MSLKQSSLDPTSPRAAGEHLPACWHRERNRNCLRIEASAGDTFIFPYPHLVAAHHQRSGNSETLRISFPNHEVTLTGRQLGEIASALQDLSVDWVKALPARYQSLAEMDGASVTQIEVKILE
ncbi:MAG: hypothetical protein ABJF10_24985 [Chthoniobacter sp.]|uniref:hypothetical protein n=1 Tax=Chthoniobacter sp. TaxID=2510640 RepID=UPI0032ADC08E